MIFSDDSAFLPDGDKFGGQAIAAAAGAGVTYPHDCNPCSNRARCFYSARPVPINGPEDSRSDSY